jgi:ketosteroid isomerase-like protein
MKKNEQIVTDFFRDMSAKGMQQAVKEYGTDDFVWWINGLGDLTEIIPKLSAAFAKHFDERQMLINPIRMISDGDFVTVEAKSASTFRNGGTYENGISYWITFSGTKISRLHEYLDTVYGNEVMAPIMADVYSDTQIN